jgi:hypothetical protein
MKPLNQNKMTRQERLKEWIKTLNEELNLFLFFF